ncbi:hypothetical protein [Chryseobacterium sp.]|uniref:hypothetical protein n=1 Tax=Chryseobacterium sp. TaxID=1871047 RepID=UPI000EBFE214|nr:hypothetical protein [Chryseobacterium sp.]HCA09274.1 hypothetical protein [Chryseobacterium sp.]
MKFFKANESSGSLQLLNEKEERMGELLFGFIGGLNDRMKIGDEVYTIKGTGFLWMGTNIFDASGRLVLKIDASKSRIFYYGETTEIYTYQHKGWLSKKLNLYNWEDRLLVSLHHKQKFLKTIYTIEIDEDFNNSIIILSFLNFYHTGLSSG